MVPERAKGFEPSTSSLGSSALCQLSYARTRPAQYISASREDCNLGDRTMRWRVGPPRAGGRVGRREEKHDETGFLAFLVSWGWGGFLLWV